jgi:arylsulfatase A
MQASSGVTHILAQQHNLHDPRAKWVAKLEELLARMKPSGDNRNPALPFSQTGSTMAAFTRRLHSLLAIVPWALLLVCGSSPWLRAAEKPNIVLVLFDDMGWGQPPSYVAESALRTPNFDRLAQQGMRFTDAHSAAAVCTPTRYGLLTGRYPSRIGQFGVLTTYSPPLIPPTRLTVASLLKQHGYHTACIGKWHLGMNWVDGKPGTESQVPIGARMTGGPNDLGFDYFCGFTHARNIGTVIEQDRVVAHVTPVENQPLMLKKALAYIDERAKGDEPFFLYVPLCPPHEPIVPAAAFVGQSGATDVVRQNPKYGDWVYQGDAMLGQILEALERNKIAENSLIIATSDNGAEQRPYPPLRAAKRSIYEGGHRVPLVVRWPGRVKAGVTTAETVCLNDVMATVAEIVGAKLPDNAGEDSVSLLTLLKHGASEFPVREATVHQSSTGDLAIRQGSWKQVFFADGRRELYDLESDLSETRDRTAERPEITAHLTRLMQGYINRGRSTRGADQQNDAKLSLQRKAARGNKRKAKGPGP